MHNLLSTRARWLATLGLSALLAAVGLGLRHDPAGWAARSSYDAAHALAAGRPRLPTNAPVVVVYLDAVSYAAEGQDPNRPWDRALHARLVDRLGRAGARAVVFDILFDRPGSAEADQRFRDALRANGRVLLAGELVPSSHGPGTSAGLRSHTLTLPEPTLAAAAAGWGLANLMPDPDFVVRRHFLGFDPEHEPGLAWATARFLRLPGPNRSDVPRWVRYYGPSLALPHVSYTHALDPAATPDDWFRDRVVFVGARPMTAAVTERRDEFRNPLPAATEDLFMPAVEVHATQMLNLLRADGLQRLPPAIEAVLVCLCAGGLGWGLLRLRPWPASGAALVVEAALLVAVVFAFRRGTWGAWLVPGAVQVPLALGGSMLFHSIEWFHARRRLEARIERTRRLEAVGALASGMAHDLNNALAPVLLGVQRLRAQAASDEARGMLEAIEASTRRGAEMVRQVLAFARGQEPGKALLDPGCLLREIERIVVESWPPAIRTSVLAPPDLWPVLGNATQLHQVLLNLCSNARDAMPRGGELTLAADNVPLVADEARQIPGGRAGDFVMFLVADTGGGIPPDVWPRLFEPFFTTKPAGQGTGLGLATAAQVVRAHGGFLNVRSELGAGSTFEVYLPRATTPAKTTAQAEPILPAHAKERIAIFQGQSALRELVRSTLEAYGYTVIPAGEGSGGLAALGEGAEGLRAVLIDRGLPGAGALALLAAVRERYPRLPVILFGADAATSHSVAPDAATRCLPQPFATEDLLEALRHDSRTNRADQVRDRTT